MANLYFIHAEGTRWFKIGVTASAPEDRRKTLQTGCPHPLKVFGSLPVGSAAYDLEAACHSALGARRGSGEWFDLDEVTAAAVFYAVRDRALIRTTSEVARAFCGLPVVPFPLCSTVGRPTYFVRVVGPPAESDKEAVATWVEVGMRVYERALREGHGTAADAIRSFVPIWSKLPHGIAQGWAAAYADTDEVDTLAVALDAIEHGVSPAGLRDSVRRYREDVAGRYAEPLLFHIPEPEEGPPLSSVAFGPPPPNARPVGGPPSQSPPQDS